MSNSDIEKKFSCPNCKYIAQVAGKEYYEIDGDIIMGTRKCVDCNRLFDRPISEIISEKEKSLQYKEFEKSNPPTINKVDKFWGRYLEFLPTIKGTKNAKEIKCIWCGSLKNEIWNKEKPTCPKCNSLMIESNKENIHILEAESFLDFKTLINSYPLVILCYLESSCSFCRQVELLIPEIETENRKEFSFIKFEFEFCNNYNLDKKFKIRHLPTFLLFKNGEYLGKFSKVFDKADFIKKLRKRFYKVTNDN